MGDAEERQQLAMALVATASPTQPPPPPPTVANDDAIAIAAAAAGGEEVEVEGAEPQPQRGIVHWEVDFALGEDAPRNLEGRLRQESRWEKTNADARHHFSLREALQVQKPSILNALDDFKRVRTVASVLREDSEPADETEAKSLRSLSPELMEIVVSHAMSGQAPLVRPFLEESHRLRARTQRATTFRVFARVRPLNAQELTEGEWRAVDPDRIDALERDGQLGAAEAEDFRSRGAICAHYENINFKGLGLQICRC